MSTMATTATATSATFNIKARTGASIQDFRLLLSIMLYVYFFFSTVVLSINAPTPRFVKS